MKKTALGILFALLITFSCIFYSCTATDNNDNIPIDTSQNHTDYINTIQDLENQILELKQNQYISEADRNKEISRLEALIAELKKATEDTGTPQLPESNTPQQSEKESQFIYKVSESNAIITGYEGTETTLAIPYSIDGYTVTEIADNALESDIITDIIIPSTVNKIGWFSFEKCSALKSVTIPSSVQSIGYSAFPRTSSKLTILCSENSFALEYAKSYGINYTIV